MTSRTRSIEIVSRFFQNQSVAQKFLEETQISFKNQSNKSKQQVPSFDWVNIYFKAYPRLPRVKLPRIFSDKDISIKTALALRQSKRKFTRKEINLAEVSELLYFAMGVKNPDSKDWNKTRRFIPSAGGRYPLELYLVTDKINSLEDGLYHYNVKEHSLELLLEGKYMGKVAELANQEWVKQGRLAFIISAVSSRSCVKYKDRGLRYVLFEAGHLCQNIYLLSLIYKMSCCSIGGFDDLGMKKLLDLSDSEEDVLYLVVTG